MRALGADVALFRKTRGDSNVGALLASSDCLRGSQGALCPVSWQDGFCNGAGAPVAQGAILAPTSFAAASGNGDISFETGADSRAAQTLFRAAFSMKRDWLLRRGLYSAPIESDAMLAFFLDFAARRAKSGDDAGRRDPPRRRSRFSRRHSGLQGLGVRPFAGA